MHFCDTSNSQLQYFCAMSQLRSLQNPAFRFGTRTAISQTDVAVRVSNSGCRATREARYLENPDLIHILGISSCVRWRDWALSSNRGLHV